MTRIIYAIENLDCANCAEKVRAAVAKMPQVQSCEMSFATKRMSVTLHSMPDNDFEKQLAATVKSVEDGVNVYPASDRRPSNNASATHNHSHQHGHEHNCSHESVCGCCDEDSCPAGKQSDNKAFSRRDIIELSIAAALLIAAFAAKIFGAGIIVQAILFGLATLTGGYPVIWSGLKSLVKLQINENILMSIAVIAAFIIGEFPESALVAILFRLGELFEKAAVGKSRRGIEALSEIRPDTANLLNSSGKSIVVDARDIKIGDIIQINPFERVPLDGVIISGKSNVDCSALTGESIPIYVEPGNEIKSGSINGEGLIEVRVTGEFENSTASRILAMVEDAAFRKGHTEQLMTRFAKIYTPVVVILAVLVALLPPLLGFGSLTDWLKNALVLLVASCPCAVVISVPLCYFTGIGKASSVGILVKGSKFVESGAKTKAVLFDKTGTLTEGSLEVKGIIPANGFTVDRLAAAAAAVESHSSHPAALAITDYYKANYTSPLPDGDKFTEIPAVGVSAEIGGDSVKCGSRRVLDNPDDAGSLPDDVSIYVIINGKLAGGVIVGDRIRSEAKEAISSLRAAGIKRIAVLSGDNEKSVRSIAQQCGIDEVYAGLLPQDKLSVLENIKRETGNVMFVGDGINDSPVLSAANTGAAMGFGTQSAIESADMVVAGDNLTSIAKAIKLFRKTTAKAKQNISISMLFKAAVILLGIFGYAPMWLAVFADVGISLLAVLNACTINNIRL